MKRLLFIIAALLIGLSVSTGSIVHAVEPTSCVTEASAFELGHAQGDADQAPADAEKGIVHHHGGCHGHHVGETVTAPQLEPHFNQAALTRVGGNLFVPATRVSPALRPPIA